MFILIPVKSKKRNSRNLAQPRLFLPSNSCYKFWRIECINNCDPSSWTVAAFSVNRHITEESGCFSSGQWKISGGCCKSGFDRTREAHPLWPLLATLGSWWHRHLQQYGAIIKIIVFHLNIMSTNKGERKADTKTEARDFYHQCPFMYHASPNMSSHVACSRFILMHQPHSTCRLPCPVKINLTAESFSFLPSFLPWCRLDGSRILFSLSLTMEDCFLLHFHRFFILQQ